MTNTVFEGADVAEKRVFDAFMRACWPGWPVLAIVIVASFVLDWGPIDAFAPIALATWIIAHFAFRGKETGFFLADFFGPPVHWAAETWLRPLFAKLNAWIKGDEPHAKAEAAFVRASEPNEPIERETTMSAPPAFAMGLASFEAPPTPARAADPSLKDSAQKGLHAAKNIAAFLLRWWWAIALVMLFIGGLVAMDWVERHNPFRSQTADEVRAEVRANEAENRGQQSRAQVSLERATGARADQYNTDRNRLRAETEAARETNSDTTSIRERIARHSAFVERMRDEASAAHAASVLDYRSSVAS